MRMIDADALEQFYECGTDPDDSYADMTYIRAEHIDNAPTIEPEVRHGRWEKKNGEIYCTNCKKSKWSESFELMLRGFNFCPNCGAKMDADGGTISKERFAEIMGGADNG